MIDTIHKIHKHLAPPTRHKGIYVSLFFSLVALVASFFILNPTVSFLDISSARKSESQVDEAIREELARLSSLVEELTASESLAIYLEDGNDSELLAYTLLESKTTGIEGILVADEHGVVRSRTINPLMRGDFIFESTRWGEEVAAGRETASVEAGVTVPLVMVAGAPVEWGAEVVGAVFAAHNLTDEYAKSFQRRHLPAQAEIAFIGKTEGFVGSSFDSPEDRAVLEAYLATLILTDGEWPLRELGRRLDLSGQEYVVGAVPLSGLDGETGYALVFTAVSEVAYPALIATLITLLFLVFELRTHRRSAIAGDEKHVILIALSSAGLFTLITLIVWATTSTNVSRLIPLPQTIYNSVIEMSPDTTVFGEIFEQRIGIKVVTSGEVINAVEADLHYDNELVEVLEVIADNSICPPDFFLEREIRQSEGVVKILCLIPDGGFVGQGILAELIVRARGPGTFSIKFGEETKVLAHDGLGTNVLRTKTDGSYQSVSLDSFLGEGVPFVVYSPTHPNEERWYSSRSISFVWSKGVEKANYSYYLGQELLGSSPGTLLEYDPVANSVELEFKEDGIYYFHLNTASTTHTRKFKVDATPPEAPLIKVSETDITLGQVVRFELSSTDEGSGIQSTFYFRIGGGMLLPVRENLSVPFYDKGSHTVTVKAFDHAGNSSESSIVINVR